MHEHATVKEWLAAAEAACGDPLECARWIKEANGRGEHLLAISMAGRALKKHEAGREPESLAPLRQQFALALARAGATAEALAVLECLEKTTQPDAETLGLLGRIHKDLSGAAGAEEERRRMLEKAVTFYSAGFQLAGDTYCGINAAALSALLGRREQATALVRRVIEQLPDEEDYWSLATLAEAHLILGEVETARATYRRAAVTGSARRGDLASTRRQCRSLCHALHGRIDLLDDCFPSLTVAVFAGHRSDLPGRKKPRLPEEAIPSLRERILRWLSENAIVGVYSSAAAGADILFLECAREAGIETHVVLPFLRDGFIGTSVADAGSDWVRRFDDVLAAADSVDVVEDHTPQQCEAALQFSTRLLTARAAAMARACEAPLRALAVWDGQPAAGPGGTAESVAMWEQAGIAVDVLHPLNPQRDGPHKPSATAGGRPFASIYAAKPDGVNSEVVAMLGMSVLGYENLPDAGFITLDRDVLGALADRMAAMDWFPARQGGCGDYVFFCQSIAMAGGAALEMMRVLVEGVRASSLDLSFSMCLHVAPMQVVVNPLLNHYAHEGRAAVKLREWTSRLVPGMVHASERFADLAALERAPGFSCTYAGTLDPRGADFGFRLYRLHNAGARTR